MKPGGDMLDLRGKRVLVMGLGVNGGGLGVTRFLVEQGAEVVVTDLRTQAVLQPTLDALADIPVQYVLGEHRDADFRAADIVIRNPGVPRESRFLELARAAGARIEMEMTLFFRLCPGPIIGITGTRGKTTTTMLTGEMVRRQFPDTVVAGNLRVSALEQLPRIGPQTPVVLELSSWQLEGLGEAGLSPQYACYTNLSPDHLDRYGSMEAYAEAKEQIYLHQRERDVAVLNANLAQYAVPPHAPGSRIAYFADAVGASDDLLAQVEQRPIACWQADSLIWRHAGGAGHEHEREVICEASDVQLLGIHNRANIAAATALGKMFGVGSQHVRAAIRDFNGVPDRMELVRELDGVRYINDTTATTPTATIAALQAVAAPIVLVAGGSDKKLPFDALGPVVADHAKAVVLLAGSATARLQQVIQAAAAAPPLHGPFAQFEAALVHARQLTEPGDVVLLSPACASFGMFVNEFDRGAQFRQIVEGLV